MKKGFSLKALALAVGAAFLFNANASAQTALQTGNGDVTLELDLQNVLEFNILVDKTTMTFNTVAEYANGFDQNAAAQFKVSSNLRYKITVKSNGTEFAKVGGGATGIPLSVMQIKSYENSDAASGAASYITLTTANQEIFNSATGSINRTYGINYKATPSVTGSAAGNEFLERPTGVYSTTLTYTATQY